MITPNYIPILNSKKGELDALSHLARAHLERITPLFEIPRFTPLAKFKNSSTPVQDFLDEKVGQIESVLKELPTFVDTTAWRSDAITESGEHVLNYAIRSSQRRGILVNPVVDYDTWEDSAYRHAVSAISIDSRCHALIRVGQYGIEDFSDPDYFESTVNSILLALGRSADSCGILIDLGDVAKTSIEDIHQRLERARTAIAPWTFGYLSFSGCSLPPNIADAVAKTNSDSMVLRREMVAWKAERTERPNERLVFSDYGIRSPNSNENFVTPHANGKIRYTTNQNYHVARGYSKQHGEKGAQHYKLARVISRSHHFQGPDFSWGDSQIVRCANEEFKGNASDWVAIDTNHHVTAVLVELFEFESALRANQRHSAETR